MKRLIIILIFVFILESSAIGYYDDSQSFVQQLSELFKDYYQSVSQNMSSSQGKLLNNIKNLLAKYGPSKEQIPNSGTLEELENLEDLINVKLKKDNSRIVLFVIPESNIINCWLGQVVEERNASRNILGKNINFNVICLDKLGIHDYLYFLTQGKEMLDVGSRENSIYYNLEALRHRAENIWDFFTGREKQSYSQRYDASKFNRLRKHLQHKAWQSIYDEYLKINDGSPEKKDDFIAYAIGLIKENALIHELAHIFLMSNQQINLDITEEEEFAFLYELSFGNLPFETLDTIIGIYAKGLKDIYFKATQGILNKFVVYIQKQQLNGNPEYKKISIKGFLLKDKLQSIYQLNEGQIKVIAREILNAHMAKIT